MNSKGFGNEFNWFLKDLVGNLIDFPKDLEGLREEFDWFFQKEIKDLARNWNDFQTNFKGVAKEFE